MILTQLQTDFLQCGSKSKDPRLLTHSLGLFLKKIAPQNINGHVFLHFAAVCDVAKVELKLNS